MICLIDVTEEIRRIVVEVKRIKYHHMHDMNALNTQTNLSPKVVLQTCSVQTFDEIVVGFEDEVNDTLDSLRSEARELDILSIIGLPGMGNTTLAKKFTMILQLSIISRALFLNRLTFKSYCLIFSMM